MNRYEKQPAARKAPPQFYPEKKTVQYGRRTDPNYLPYLSNGTSGKGISNNYRETTFWLTDVASTIRFRFNYAKAGIRS